MNRTPIAAERIERAQRMAAAGQIDRRSVMADPPFGFNPGAIVGVLYPEIPANASRGIERIPDGELPRWLAYWMPVAETCSDAAWPELIQWFLSVAAAQHRLSTAEWDRLFWVAKAAGAHEAERSIADAIDERVIGYRTYLADLFDRRWRHGVVTRDYLRGGRPGDMRLRVELARTDGRAYAATEAMRFAECAGPHLITACYVRQIGQATRDKTISDVVHAINSAFANGRSA